MSAPRVAVLGGSGRFGLGLAWRLALGGAEVAIGSRSAQRAGEAASRVRRGLERPPCVSAAPSDSALAVSGTTNTAAAAAGDTVFLSVPFAAQEALLEEVGPHLAGKLVICCAVIWPPGSHPGTSAAEEAARVLRQTGGGGVRVAAAFQTVAAAVLRRPPEPAADDGSPDVLVFADDGAVREAAVQAAGLTGLRAIPVGPLRQSRAAEAALGMLLELNRRGATGAGFRVTGLGR